MNPRKELPRLQGKELRQGLEEFRDTKSEQGATAALKKVITYSVCGN
jgi:hypothetical protein